MSKEKRGYPFPNGWIHKEAQKIGPYPVWKSWRHTLVNRFPSDWEQLSNGGENILKEAYLLRREIQLGTKKFDDWSKFIDQIDKNNPGFWDKHRQLIQTLVNKTESDKVKKRAAELRGKH